MACVSRVAGFGLIYSFFLLNGLIGTQYLFPFLALYPQPTTKLANLTETEGPLILYGGCTPKL